MKKLLTITLAAVMSASLAFTALAFSQGDTGEDVQKMQEALIEQGYLDGDADGQYGPMTAEAVSAFRNANGLGDGEADDEMLSVLYGEVSVTEPEGETAPENMTQEMPEEAEETDVQLTVTVSSQDRYLSYQENAASYGSLEQIAQDYLAGNITFNEMTASVGLYRHSPAEAEEVLIEVDENALPEGLTTDDLVYENGSYYVSTDTLRRAAESTGSAISFSDPEGNSITVDTNGSISSDTGSIRTDSGDRDAAEAWTTAAEKQTTTAAKEQTTAQKQTTTAAEKQTTTQKQTTTAAEKQTTTQKQTTTAAEKQTTTAQQTQPATTKQAETTTSHTHTWVTVSGYAATCSSSGLTDGTKCSTCGAVGTAQQTIAALGHSWVTTSAATCTEPGYMTCTRCGESIVSQDALGHDWREVEYGYKVYYKDPQYVCNVCGYMTTDIEDIGAHCASVCGSGYYVDFYVVDYTECLGETDYADYWNYIGNQCTRCGAWQ